MCLSKVGTALRWSSVTFCLILLAVFGTVATQTAEASDAKGKFAIRGAGTVMCKAYLNVTPAQRKIVETWWAGYLTAMNRTTAKTYDVLGNLSVKNANDWLMRYCKKHPARRLAFAVHDLLKAAYGSRLKVSPSAGPR
jgi:predicted TIM-barrel fold metal-dependent hydrolase